MRESLSMMLVVRGSNISLSVKAAAVTTDQAGEEEKDFAELAPAPRQAQIWVQGLGVSVSRMRSCWFKSSSAHWRC